MCGWEQYTFPVHPQSIRTKSKYLAPHLFSFLLSLALCHEVCVCVCGAMECVRGSGDKATSRAEVLLLHAAQDIPCVCGVGVLVCGVGVLVCGVGMLVCGVGLLVPSQG